MMVGIVIVALVALVGVTVAVRSRSPETPVATWQVEREGTIGSEEDPNEQFTRIPSILMDSRGHLFVALSPENEIREFDAQGAHVRTIGRKGEGPGEFRLLHRIQFLRDSLVAVDVRARRTTLFDGEGREVRTLRYPVERLPSGVGSPIAVFADGSALFGESFSADELADDTTRRTDYYRLHPDGEFHTVTTASPHGANVFSRQGAALLAMNAPVPHDDLVGVDARRGVVVVVERRPARSGREADFSVHRVGVSAGDSLGGTFAYEPSRIAPEMADEVRVGGAAALARLSAIPGGARIRETMRATHTVPEYEPPVSALVMGDDGTIWLRREAIGRETVTWWVLDERLERIAELRLPAALQIRYADRERIVGLLPDEMDVPAIVRYRVRRG